MKGKLILKQNLDSQQINPYSQGSKLLGASLIPIYESENNLTAQEINKQIVDEILLKKEQEKKSTQQSEFNTDDVIKLQKLIPGLKKCKFHTKKLSSKCKECQIITITVQKHELELRNKIKKELDQKMFEKQENTIEATEEISNENINDNNKEDNIVINDSPQSNSGFNSNINANQCIIPSNSNIPYNMMAYQIPIPNMQIPIPMNLPNMPHINAMMLQKMPYMNFPMNSQMNQFNQVSQFNQFQLINQQIPIIPKFKPLELSQYEFIPVTDQSSCNLNPLLHNNILSCHYFKELYNTKHSFGEMCLEITEKVTSVEPWALGQIGIPSTIFCCLYRLMLMKLNIYQLKLLINNGELTSEMQNPAVYAVLDININTKLKPSIFLKTVGYLYLRFLANPIELLTWFEPDLGNVNQYPLLLKANKDLEHGITSSTSIDIEFGEFLDKVLRNTDYYNTRFPKIPVLIEKEIINKLDEYKEFRKRKNANIEEFDSLRVGSRIIVKISATGESVIKHKWVSAVVVGFNEDSVDDFISVRLDNDEGRFILFIMHIIIFYSLLL